MIFILSQELSPQEEKENLDLIASQHAKQLHWKQTLKFEEEQLEIVQEQVAKVEKDQFEEAEKLDISVKKATRALEASKEKAHLREVVDDLVNNVSAGETSLHSVVRTLSEFLGKLLLTFLF